MGVLRVHGLGGNLKKTGDCSRELDGWRTEAAPSCAHLHYSKTVHNNDSSDTRSAVKKDLQNSEQLFKFPQVIQISSVHL